jgi:hypothetical protein
MTNVARLDDHRRLDLGDKPVVVPPKRAKRATVVVPDTSAAFDRAWAVYPDDAHRSTKRLSWPQWVLVAGVIGEPRLEAAVLAYVRDPKEREQRARCGAPGFQVWLRQGRWEHWLDAEAPAPVKVAAAATFPDAELRDSFFARFKDERARRWFDRSGWDAETKTFFWAWTPTQAWMDGAFWPWALASGIDRLKAKRG